MRACSDTCDCVIFGLSDCPQEVSLSSALHSHATGRFSGISFAFSFLLGLFLHFKELFLLVDLAHSMAAHVRNDRDVLSALELLGQTDPGQLSSVCRTLPAQMRSSLMASIGASFAAADEPGPSTSPPDQPWLASSTLHSSTPPQSGDALHSEQTQMLRGHPVRKVEIIACREPCQHCALAMCGFQTENPLDSHFAGQGKHTCKRCYRSIRDRNIGSVDAQQPDSWSQGDGSWQQGDGSWWGGNWGSSRW